MADQVQDRRTIGIPSDVEIVRHDVESFKDAAGSFAEQARDASANAAMSEEQARAHAASARESAQEAADWATIHNQGIHFGPTEPDIKWEGMTWLMTDEADRRIVSFRRWDSMLAGSALFPSPQVYPSESVFPAERGAWTDFTV